jgi:hypothetical protein
MMGNNMFRMTRCIIIAVQMVALGCLLFFALLKVLAPAMSGRVFHYQGF